MIINNNNTVLNATTINTTTTTTSSSSMPVCIRDNINSILSGLNKKIDLSNQNESTISIEEIENMSNIPISRRKRRSEKSSISIDV
jgi:hypothetical protein